MCAKQAWVDPDAGDPFVDQPSILPCRNSSVAAATAAKEVLTRLLVGGSDVVVDRLTGLLSHLEPNWLAGLLLAHRRRSAACPCGATSSTLSRTTSQPLSLLSMARLNIARSRVRR